MQFYPFDNEEDEFTAEEISLANGFCEACDKGILKEYDEDQYDVIISHLMFSQRGDYLKKAVERARRAFPDDPAFAIWQARYYIWNNQMDEAQQFMQKTLRHFPASAELYEEMAFIAYTFHFNMNIRELVTKAIAIEPSANAYFLLTNLYLDQNNVDKAYDCFQESYRYDNSVIQSIDLLIQSQNAKKGGRYEAELEFAERLTKDLPLCRQVRLATGTLYALDGKHNEALEAFEFAASIESDCLILYAIAQEYCQLGQYERSIEYCKLIAETDKEIKTNVLIAKSLRNLGHFEDALLQLLKADEHDLDFPFVFSELVLTLNAMGRMEDIPDFIDRFYQAENLTLEKLEWVLDCLSLENNSVAFHQLCLSAENQFKTATDYCAWLTEFCYIVHTPGVALDILAEKFTDLPDEELYEHLGYFLALLHIANANPRTAAHHLHNALVLNENNIFEDFLDIDSEKLYAQYPDIYFMVSPYLDHVSDVRNN